MPRMRSCRTFLLSSELRLEFRLLAFRLPTYHSYFGWMARFNSMVRQELSIFALVETGSTSP